jgi:hypothetical protein
MIVESQEKLWTRAKSLWDNFADECKPGQVIGSRSSSGVLRRGIDREDCMSIDNGALRIQPLHTVGWGRVGLNYEPYYRQPGLALAVYMLNGHNTSQCGGIEPFRSRMGRWWTGSETYSRPHRLLQWIRSGRIARALRQFRWWRYLDRNALSLPKLDENLAVGWFNKEVPDNPLEQGDAFLMHATGAENGELWATVRGSALPAVRSVQNLQIYYVVVLRQKGAAFYAASVPDANGLAPYPEMRPLAIDPFNSDQVLYPGVHQSVLGQIGFRLDTRVYGVRVEQLEEFENWFGSAHLAAHLRGSEPVVDALADRGGRWRIFESQDGELAILDPGSPSGLIHALLDAGCQRVGLAWRFKDTQNFWQLLIDERGCRLSIRLDGEVSEIAVCDAATLPRASGQSLQILDDGDRMSFHLDGELLFGARFRDTRLEEASGAGLLRNSCCELFEAHPRTLPIPASLRLGEPWLRKGAEIVVADEFDGELGDLNGRVTSLGDKVWKREIGSGTMEVDRGAVKIRATAKKPNPGRTAYMLDWDKPEFSDVAVTITPAGTGPDEREHGLCGFILWQDPDNYITINIWVNHSYDGASISCFFQLDGFEDLYDAIWSNVGKRVYYGVPVNLRVVFSEDAYTVFVDDEPVLFRKLSDVYPDYGRFAVCKVGLLANWEWGNDTGSTFSNFVGRV